MSTEAIKLGIVASEFNFDITYLMLQRAIEHSKFLEIFCPFLRYSRFKIGGFRPRAPLFLIGDSGDSVESNNAILRSCRWLAESKVEVLSCLAKGRFPCA